MTMFLALTPGFSHEQPARFEVASIKPIERCERVASNPGSLNTCGTLTSLIKTAYVTFVDGTRHPSVLVPIEGGPAWMNTDLFQIAAKAQGTPGVGIMSGPMLQALLEDCFKLKTHRETREVPAYGLSIAKGGSKLQPFKEGSCITLDPIQPSFPIKADDKVCGLDFARLEVRNGRNFTREVHGITLDQFSLLLGSILNRPVINKTGLTGLFDFSLEYSADETTPGTPAAGSSGDDLTYATIFTSVQEQFGLKLDSTRGPGQFLVIDSVERPKPN
jgi:uncharacterized protein (TIGR03435 family)